MFMLFQVAGRGELGRVRHRSFDAAHSAAEASPQQRPPQHATNYFNALVVLLFMRDTAMTWSGLAGRSGCCLMPRKWPAFRHGLGRFFARRDHAPADKRRKFATLRMRRFLPCRQTAVPPNISALPHF
jgi:hypothetical protein